MVILSDFADFLSDFADFLSDFADFFADFGHHWTYMKSFFLILQAINWKDVVDRIRFDSMTTATK